MIRISSAVVVLSVALLSSGCEEPPPKACGTYERMAEELDLSACQSGEVAAIQRAGIWHGLIHVPEFKAQRMVIDFTSADDPKWDGATTHIDDFTDGRFYMRQTFVDTFQNTSLSTSVLGCRAPQTGKITGLVQICATNYEPSNGEFELTQLQPLAGEQTSSGGLTLVSEKKVSEGRPRHLTVVGGYAYVTTNNAVSVFDLAANQECGRLPALGENPNWMQSAMVGDQLYVGSIDDGLLLVQFGGSRCNPQINGAPRLAGQAIQALLHDPVRKVVFAASAWGDIFVLNVNIPTSPVKVNQFRAAENDYAKGAAPQGLHLSGDRLYVNYGTAGYVVFQLPSNLVDGAPPTQLGAAFAPDGDTSVNSGVFTAADKTYALETIQGWNGHIRALDVTNPIATTAVGSFALRPEISVGGIDLVGSRLYLAYHQDGLRIVDFATPSAPTQVAHYNTWNLAETSGEFFEGLVSLQVARDGSGLIYALDTKRGLMVFDETP